jgi:hypothetical protein
MTFICMIYHCIIYLPLLNIFNGKMWWQNYRGMTRKRTRFRKYYYCKRYYLYGNKKRMSDVRNKSVRRTRNKSSVITHRKQSKKQQQRMRVNNRTSTSIYALRISQPLNVTSHISFVSSKKANKSRPLLFESDSDWIGVDTFSTYCMTNNINDFVMKPERCNHQVLGVSNIPTSITHKGEVSYKITDDLGCTHIFRVPEMYYCPTVPYRVLSPQSIDKQWRLRKISTVSERTSSQGTVLYWTNKKGNEYTKTIKHNERSSVPMFLTQPSIKQY